MTAFVARMFAGVLLGGGLGFAYYKLIGCSTGACPLTSSATAATVYGAVVGILIAGSFSR